MVLDKEGLNKFNALLKSIRTDAAALDLFMSKPPHIYRNIRGHAFEIWFDREMQERSGKIKSVGGDSVGDREINGHALQLKTPYIKGTVDGRVVGYRMHKTHGAEVKPYCYYTKEEFADYLVGLHPNGGVIICPRKYLPTRGEVSSRLDYPDHLADPLPFDWNTKWLNRYDLLGLKIEKPPTISGHTASEAKLFPKLISRIGFTDYDIVHAIIDERNFRTWYQLIVGSIRELHFSKFAEQHGINLNPPASLATRGTQKVDYLLDNGKRIQVKGLTKGMCKGDILGCETQCSHGRVPNRLYRRSDFDYIAIVIDPESISPKIAKTKGISSDNYNFVIVPMSKLPRHPRSDEWNDEYIKSSFLFKADEVEYNRFELISQK